MFAPVGGGKVNLQDVKVVGYEGETADAVNIQILDNLGRTTQQYFFADLPEDELYGWFDGDGEYAEGVKFAAGAGLWVFAETADYSIVIPGVSL